ncbi:hypothetical protein [Nocardioides marmotae]|uniref:hypothetical protein n=1 Tax=Nocardioides marmotae TaxID=2663857 RepID=UPI0012B50C0C|nr:hypothetical protein [Nocardioides marmotae]MBC9733036.1 hypothetical protein [Nocardioides marmotae]MTB84150.1 hypothetical protein [Nocardioides marmotae]
MTTEPFWTALVDDAAIFPPGDAELATAAEAYAARTGDAATLTGSFVVRDTDLPALPAGFAGPLTVVVTGGAGQLAGPAALCARRGLPLAGLDVALRDLDDLAGNARRVVAAVDAARAEGVLDDDVAVHVELPQSEATYAWLAAADEVAAAELRLKLRTGGLEVFQHPPAPLLATWIDAALDRETPFRCTAGLHRALRHTGDDGAERHGFLNLLAATRRAFEGAGADEVVATLEDRDLRPDPAELAAGRRWFTSFGSCSVEEPMADIRALGVG